MKLDNFGHPTRVVVDTGPLLDALLFLARTSFDRKVLRFDDQVQSFLDFLHSREARATTTAVVVEIAAHFQKLAKKAALVSMRKAAAQLLVESRIEELNVRVLKAPAAEDFAELGPADASLMQACRESHSTIVTPEGQLIAACCRKRLPVFNVYSLLP
jgi:cell fate (sporulation/competence/biofilm development) regulator YmcA (YheA/YmcA/DUF963 family)